MISMYIKKGYILFLLILILGFFNVYADKFYYASVNIEIYDDGEVEISGITNHPDLQSQRTHDYTSKEKALWVLNITLDELFSDYVFEIKFPKNAVVNYLKIPNILSMEEESGSLVITSIGKNEKFHVIAQYSINQKENANVSFIGLFLLLIILGIVLYFFVYKKKSSKLKYNPQALTDRQKQILDLVIKNKGSTTQSKLQKSIGIPKASLSRNIDSLVRKGILIKESKGMTNVVSLKRE